MGRFWTFRDYVDGDGENLILAWLNERPKDVKAKINALIRRLELMEKLDRPQVGKLDGTCAGLLELRIKGADKIQYRPLCCNGPGVA